MTITHTHTPYVTGLITIDGSPETTVLAQYDPRERWNGWLCPRIDALSVVQILDALNATNYANGEHVMEYDFDTDGSLLLQEYPIPDDGDWIPVDEDGLYSLGAYGWVWSEYIADDNA